MHINKKSIIRDKAQCTNISQHAESNLDIRGKIYIPIENISRGIDQRSNPLLARAIEYCTIAGEIFDEIQKF